MKIFKADTIYEVGIPEEEFPKNFFITRSNILVNKFGIGQGGYGFTFEDHTIFNANNSKLPIYFTGSNENVMLEPNKFKIIYVQFKSFKKVGFVHFERS